jgi:hypothetical protein
MAARPPIHTGRTQRQRSSRIVCAGEAGACLERLKENHFRPWNGGKNEGRNKRNRTGDNGRF